MQTNHVAETGHKKKFASVVAEAVQKNNRDLVFLKN